LARISTEYNRTCVGRRVRVRVHITKDKYTSYGNAKVSLSTGQNSGRVDYERVYLGYYVESRTVTLEGPAERTMWINLACGWNPWYVTSSEDTVRIRPGILPSLSLTGLDFPSSPCTGSIETIKATVSETSGRCGGNFHLEWLDKSTKSISISAGGVKEVPLEFKVPRNSLDITVNLIDEERNTTVGTRVASIDPKVPEITPPKFEFEKRIPKNLCPGTKVSGNIIAEVKNCTQNIKGRIIDTVSGETFASFGPKKYSPGTEISPNFSFSMPYDKVMLKCIIYRKTPQDWKSVASATKEIGLKRPSTKVGSLEAPDRECAGFNVEPSIKVASEVCPQRLRSRLVDEETGNVVSSWSEKELKEGEKTSFKFPFEMPWRSIPIRADVERYNPVAGTWESIESKRKEIGQKTPATGVIVSREIAKYGRPGWSTSGSMVVRNDGECLGDVLVEGYIAGERMMSETYTLEPGETKTPTYAATMPAKINPEVSLVVKSQRKERMKPTSTEVGSIESERFVSVGSSNLLVKAGAEPIEYAGVIVARDVELEGPIEKERREPISFPKKAVPVAFAGRVEPHERDVIGYAEDSLVYLRMRLSKSVSYTSFRRLEDRDTNEVVYSTLEEVRPAKPPKLPLPKFFYRRRS